MNIKDTYEKYKDIFWYLFFGVCTTLVNVVTYWAAAHLLNMGTIPSTLLAWLLAVLFAYITNRTWVFRSEVKGWDAILKEIIAFFSCRIATGVVDWLAMFVFVDLLLWNDVFVKFFANVVVIVLNYVASKLVIFRKNKNE